MKNKIFNFLRWLVALPGAFIAAYAVWFVIYNLNKYTIIWYLDSFDFQERLLVEFLSHAAAGAGFIISFLRIIPIHHNSIAYILAIMVIFSCGIFATFAFNSRDWWAIFAIFSVVVGAGLTVYKNSDLS